MTKTWRSQGDRESFSGSTPTCDLTGIDSRATREISSPEISYPTTTFARLSGLHGRSGDCCGGRASRVLPTAAIIYCPLAGSVAWRGLSVEGDVTQTLPVCILFISFHYAAHVLSPSWVPSCHLEGWHPRCPQMAAARTVRREAMPNHATRILALVMDASARSIRCFCGGGIYFYDELIRSPVL